MKKYDFNRKVKNVSAIGLGCMRLAGLKEEAKVRELVDVCMENGINLFDHADIYAGGECETIFGRAIPTSMRENIILQSKCCIRPGICYDASKEYIISEVDGILRRLNTEYLDVLLLHRPDALMEPEEIAETFDELAASGKVRCFGVSNHSTLQIELLNSYCNDCVKINQIQYSIAHCPSVDQGINVNINNQEGCDRTGDILSYSRLKGIRLQAWSPFQYGAFEGTFLGNSNYAELNRILENLARKYETTINGIAVAWIMRHPAGIMPIVGTTTASRIPGIAKAADITLTREEWYELYLSVGRPLP